MLLNQPENGVELRNVIASSQGVVHIKREIFFKYMGINVRQCTEAYWAHFVERKKNTFFAN